MNELIERLRSVLSWEEKRMGAVSAAALKDVIHCLASMRTAEQSVRMELLSRLQSAAQPYDQACGDAVIPAALWREFVDAHAEALFRNTNNAR